MRQTHLVGMVFLCGLLFGSVFVYYFIAAHHDALRYLRKSVARLNGTSLTEQPEVVGISHVMLEVRRLRGVIAQMTARLGNATKIAYVEKTPTSHEELDLIPGTNRMIHFKDSHFHVDDHRMANELAKKVRVLCWITTYSENLQKRAIHIKNTWGKRCNKLLFFSDKDERNFPAIGLGVDTGREHLTAKTMRAFDYIYKHYYNEADWFLKADDDTYVIVENLRYMLSAHSPSEAIYFGQVFSVIVKQGYNSGGAGYILSAEALSRFAKRDASLCAQDRGAEDVEMGLCLEKLHVVPGDTRDKLGRSRFHCFNPQTHLHGGYPDWYSKYDKYGAKKGVEWMSDYPVSFHYMSPNAIYDIEYFIYHLGVYGIVKGLQDLNSDPEQH
ncbi:hypothetical protein LSH36_1321g00053 [Paralvinella palmiformis]|uniref:Glycoprotein-N-acetylgalactosamine 3-beta-galactosyltransferase 1 n=1 Tax=Paralvinella palmiformis TaxID=53620 RepID=A0AAD9MNM5_9ANNE|nr:hypothetical protein LSH36_1321g00053 [Paralvinella palmiformis]